MATKTSAISSSQISGGPPPANQAAPAALTQHELFPPRDGDLWRDLPDLAWIHVVRVNPQTGASEWAPKRFAPKELATHEDVFNRYGGGEYEFVARDKRGVIIAREPATIAGEPLSLAPRPAPPPPASSPNATQNVIQATIDPRPVAPGPQQDPFAFMMGMMNMQMNMMTAMVDRDAARAAASIAQSQQTMQMIVAIASNDKAQLAALYQQKQANEPDQLKAMEFGMKIVRDTQQATKPSIMEKMLEAAAPTIAQKLMEPGKPPPAAPAAPAVAAPPAPPPAAPPSPPPPPANGATS